MRIQDIEVLGVKLLDESIRGMLDKAQKDVVSSNIELSSMARNLDLTQKKAEIVRTETQIQSETKKLQDRTSVELLTSSLEVKLTELANQLKVVSQNKAVQAESEALTSLSHDAKMARTKSEAAVKEEIEADIQLRKIELIVAETKALTDRLSKSMPGFAEALIVLGDKDAMVKVAEAWNIQRAIGGDNLTDSLRRVFENTPLQAIMEKIAGAGTSVPNGKHAISAPPTA